MINARKNILNDKGVAPTELEEEVAKVLFDIEATPSSDIKAVVRDINISGVQESDMKTRTAIMPFPFRMWKNVRTIHSRLVREMEEKFGKQHIVFIILRTMLNNSFKRKWLQVRPRGRTLTAVHEVIVEDVVAPSASIGVDGFKVMNIILDPKGKDKDDVDAK